ncbi:aminotransferase class V-fold PLP-dependent enzyme [Erysipelothrix rhusiopathiae]|nr:aminotransferase class V-fold PLP-dependent enzyme [Erysipelothrix rhusiopathiae]MDE8158908.1 aminotransferase class V-fold PLP-dependent enzyme [Erysipelothrix rhusiopathiae]MDE8294739.1 aminotransferase class V-fold PLP-dependent enzyme [Erysipelothrix rhusiopathiae]MDE8298209.1 aminotransferase class V-fold PLP-dependent enzyme [Erysipelothrix rhusiopathiae]
MLNFTVGPVMMRQDIMDVGAEPVPYFRTPEFSDVMLENELIVKEICGARDEDKVVVLTGSGTAAMDAAIVNCAKENDKFLIVNGGSFGARFCEICSVYDVNFESINLDFGQSLTSADLEPYENAGFTGFLVNLDETSSGVLYDIDLISSFCKRNNLFLIVDAISAFLADEIMMAQSNIDILITGSQKALALPPGLSILVLSEDAQCRVDENKRPCYYLDLKSALSNAKRGQTPFTPAVGIVLQLNLRLKQVKQDGIDQTIGNTRALAMSFRSKIEDYGFKCVTDSSSNAVTALYVPEGKSAKEIFTVLKDEYEIWVTPSGGAYADSVIRVSHIGEITQENMETLYNALDSLKERGII